MTTRHTFSHPIVRPTDVVYPIGGGYTAVVDLRASGDVRLFLLEGSLLAHTYRYPDTSWALVAAREYAGVPQERN